MFSQMKFQLVFMVRVYSYSSVRPQSVPSVKAQPVSKFNILSVVMLLPVTCPRVLSQTKAFHLWTMLEYRLWPGFQL